MYGEGVIKLFEMSKGENKIRENKWEKEIGDKY